MDIFSNKDEMPLAFFNVIQCKNCHWYGEQKKAEVRKIKGMSYMFHCPECGSNSFAIGASTATNGITFQSDLSELNK